MFFGARECGAREFSISRIPLPNIPLPQVCHPHNSVSLTLPDMPLFLSPDWYVHVPLETTYAQAYRGLSEFWRDVIEGRRPPE